MAYATSSIYLIEQPLSPVDLAMELSVTQRLADELKVAAPEPLPLVPSVAPANSNTHPRLPLPEQAIALDLDSLMEAAPAPLEPDDFDAALAALVASTATIQPVMAPAVPQQPETAAAPPTTSPQARQSRARLPLLAVGLAAMICLGGALGVLGARYLVADDSPTALQHELKFLRGQVSSLNKEISGLRGEPARKQEAPVEVPPAAAAVVSPAISVVAPDSSRISRSSEGPGRSQATPATSQQAAHEAAGHDGATRPNIVEGYVLRDVYSGTALIQSRKSLHEVKVGEILPGLGRIEAIRREGSRWIVDTPKGQLSAGVL